MLSILLVPLILINGIINLNWNSAQNTEAVNVKVNSHDEILERCAQSGIEVRYRYLVKICKRRNWWFDQCSEEKQYLQSLQFDPISESYKITTDRIGDPAPPEVSVVTRRSEAFEAISSVNDVSLDSIATVQEFPRDQKTYVSVRLLSECKGEYSQIATGLTTIATLGLIKVGWIDSGWIDFWITGSGTEEPKG